MSALSLGYRHRWTERGAKFEDGEDGERAVLRQLAHLRERTRARVQRPGVGRKDPQVDTNHGHWRAIRREILLSRRARDSPTASRRLVPHRPRRFVLGRSTSAREDHKRRRVHRGAGNGSEQVPSRRTRGQSVQRSRARRFEPADV